MAVDKFKFVSPGIFINEIDKSQTAEQGTPPGPVLIGRFERGPGMRPVRVNSFSEFVQIFGGVIEAGSGGQKDSYKYLTNSIASSSETVSSSSKILTFLFKT